MGIFSNRKIRYFVAHLTLWSFIFHIFGLSALQVAYADDVTPPVVTIIGADPLIIAHGSVFSDPGASWTDDVDGSGVIQASSGSVNSSIVGSYNLEYLYTDAALNPSNLVTRVVEVTDQTAPVITLSGANPFSLDLGTPYVDPGSSCSDNVDIVCNVVSTGTVDHNSVGTYTIVYDAVDLAENVALSLTRTVNVTFASGSDTTSPVVTLIGSNPIDVLSGSLYADSGATWTDNVDGSGSILTGIYADTGSFQSSGSVNTSQTGTYTIEYLKVDAAGNTGSVIRTVNVVEVLPSDTTSPVVTLIGSNPIDVLSGSLYVDSGATWTDNVDGSGSILTGIYADTGSFQSSGSVNTSQTGTYTIEYLKVDAAGNTGSVIRTVNVVELIDNIPPVISLIGSGSIIVAQNSTYIDSGATWTDNVDGSGALVASGIVNTAVLGTYTLTYDKIDIAGNSAITVNRTVMVTDQTNPTAIVEYSTTGATNQSVIVTLTGASESISLTNNGGSYTYTFTSNGIFTFTYIDDAGNSGSTTAIVNNIDTDLPIVTLVGSGTENIFSGSIYVDSGATWTDNVDGSGSILAYNSGTLNTSSTGTYLIEYVYVDSAGNTGSITRTVVVLDLPDTNSPVVTLSGSTNITLEVGTPYTDDGASWIDDVDGSGSILDGTFTLSGSVNVNLVGTYILVYEKVDSSFNTGSASRIVTVVDTTAPIVTTNTGTDTVEVNTSWIDAGAEWTDNNGNTGSILGYTSGSVNTSLVGSYTVDYQIFDGFNTGSASRIVTVVDTTAPIVTTNTGTDTVEVNTSWIDAGAEWTDNNGNTGSILGYTSGSVNTAIVGSYAVDYQIFDGFNTGSASRTVTVVDTIAPIVTLVGLPIVNILLGGIYSESGATWIDNADGSGVILTPTSGSVNTSLTDTYILTYIKIDSSGHTGSVSRTVNVLSAPDLTAPIITLIGSGIITIPQGSIYTDLGATWTDNVDGSGTVIASGSVNTAILGTYLLTYDKIDSSGNAATTVTRSVTVADQTAPTAIVTYSTLLATSGSVVATLTGASEPITITNNSGSNTFTFTSNGSFTFDFVDAVGNTGSTTATVNNIDQTAPTAIVTYSTLLATSGSVVATLTGASEPITITNNSGSNTFTFTSNGSFTFDFVDAVGNTGSTTATVNNIFVPVPPIQPPVTGPGGGGGGGGSSYPIFVGLPLVGWNTGTILVPFTGSILPKFIQKNIKLRNLIQKQKFLFFPKGFFVVNVPRTLNVRFTKSLTDKNIIGSLRKGQKIKVQYMDTNGWSLVVLPSGKWGFVRSEYLTAIK